MRKLPDFETRGGYKKADFNLLVAEVERLGRMSVQWPLEISNQPGGPLLRVVNQGFWAQLTSRTGDQYEWEEVQPDTTTPGNFYPMDGGRTSQSKNFAYEINGVTVVPPQVVWLMPGQDPDYLFSTGIASSPLTTKGDIFGFSTHDDRIPVGSNGQVLTADSTQPLGVKWASAGGGGFPFTGCAAVFNSGTQISFNDNVDTRIPLPGEFFDTNTLHDPVTNNSRVSLLSLGTTAYWNIRAVLYVSVLGNVAGSLCEMNIYQNNTLFYPAMDQRPFVYWSTTNTSYCQLQADYIYVNGPSSAPYFELYCRQHTGGAVQAPPNGGSYLSVVRVG